MSTLLRWIKNDLIYFRVNIYADGYKEVRLRVHPLMGTIIIILLILGGWLFY
jgi:hypothetical protein